jgi:hypothetical protein
MIKGESTMAKSKKDKQREVLQKFIDEHGLEKALRIMDEIIAIEDHFVNLSSAKVLAELWFDEQPK